MTPTATKSKSTSNRSTGTAVTLLGLLATITGAAQALEPPPCVCSPQQYEVTFDLDQAGPGCDGEIANIPVPDGVEILNTPLCASDPGSAALHSNNAKPPDAGLVTRVQIDEFPFTGTGTGQTTKNIPILPSTTFTFQYDSMSKDFVAGVPIGDQVVGSPSALSVELYGNNQETGEPDEFLAASFISFTGECTGPISFQNTVIGNVRLSTLLSASDEWCKKDVTPSPTPSMSYSSSMSISNTLALAKAGKGSTGKAAKKAKASKAA